MSQNWPNVWKAKVLLFQIMALYRAIMKTENHLVLQCGRERNLLNIYIQSSILTILDLIFNSWRHFLFSNCSYKFIMQTQVFMGTIHLPAQKKIPLNIISREKFPTLTVGKNFPPISEFLYVFLFKFLSECLFEFLIKHLYELLYELLFGFIYKFLYEFICEFFWAGRELQEYVYKAAGIRGLLKSVPKNLFFGRKPVAGFMQL